MLLANSPKLAESNVKLRKPGPAISIFFIPEFLLKSSTNNWATSLGFLPAGFATISAILLEKFP